MCTSSCTCSCCSGTKEQENTTPNLVEQTNERDLFDWFVIGVMTVANPVLGAAAYVATEPIKKEE